MCNRSLRISLCEDRRLKDTHNLKCENKRHKKYLVLKTEDGAPKREDWRFEFLAGKIWLLGVLNWEDSSLWYLPHTVSRSIDLHCCDWVVIDTMDLFYRCTHALCIAMRMVMACFTAPHHLFIWTKVDIMTIGHVNEYPTMQYFGNPRNTQSMIA